MGSSCASGQCVVLAVRPGCQCTRLRIIEHHPSQSVPSPRWFFCYARLPPTTTQHTLGLHFWGWFFHPHRHCHRSACTDIAKEKRKGGCDETTDVVCGGVSRVADGPVATGEAACQRERVVAAYFGGGGACDVCLEGQREWG